jgi:hypothetical protein
MKSGADLKLIVDIDPTLPETFNRGFVRVKFDFMNAYKIHKYTW